MSNIKDSEKWDTYISKYDLLTNLMEEAGIDTNLLDDLIKAAQMI